MKILGIDCGSERTGYGIIASDGRRHTLLASGTIRTSPKQPLSERLRLIGNELKQVVALHAPECGVVEEVFHAANTQTALKLAHVRGVVLYTMAEAGLPVAEYSPLEIKKTVVGYGRAEKEQVQMMVQSLLGLPEILASQDASDAVAAAICHAAHQGFQSRLAASARVVAAGSR